MKTNTNNKNQKSELKNRPEQLSTDKRPKIDFKLRHANRKLDTEKLLALLRNKTPNFFNLAEVVGKWVWIQFTDKQPREVTARLAEFGFHWNNKRQVWQHPCGALTEGTESDPREKYPTYFPADAKPA